MTHLDKKTKEELVAIYNDSTPSKVWGTLGKRTRSGVAVLGNKVDANIEEYDNTHKYIIGPKGEARWAYSNNIVPSDILEMAVVDGTIDIELRNKTEEVRAAEDEIFLKNYINFRQENGYSEEELMEIDAEFGDDEEPVDFFTGREIRTGKFVL